MADGEDKKAITLYTAGTPNGWKVSVVLEELGIPYKVHRLVLSTQEQKEEWFLKINPNGRIPAIVDHENGDFPVFESGAIMMYLCDRFDTEGKLFPKEGKQRHEVIQWLMFQMGGLGPMQGQAHHFVRYAPVDVEYARNRYIEETDRLCKVLESRLSTSKWLAAEKYTIADIANHSWLSVGFWGRICRSDYPNVQEWARRIEERESVRKGMDVPVPMTTKLKVANLIIPILDKSSLGRWLARKLV